MALGVTAASEGIQKWRTPDGELYFGGSPPEGSRPIREIEPSEKAGNVAPSARGSARGTVDIPARGIPRRVESSGQEAVTGSVVFGPYTVTRTRLGFIVAGVVRNTVGAPVYDVAVGSEGTWVNTEPGTIPTGGEAFFELEVAESLYGDTGEMPPVQLRWHRKP